MPGEELEQDAADRVEIRSRIGRLSVDLLGRHVRGRSRESEEVVDDLAPESARGVPGQAEVHEHRTIARQEDDVLRLQIAVDDSLVVQQSEGDAQAAHDAKHARQLAVRRELRVLRGARTQHVVQRLAAEELHRVPGRAVLEAVVHHADDTGKADAPQRVDLAAQARQGVRGEAANGLDGDPVTGLAVRRPVDDAHVPRADLGFDVVRPEAARGWLFWGRGGRVHDGQGAVSKRRARYPPEFLSRQASPGSPGARAARLLHVLTLIDGGSSVTTVSGGGLGGQGSGTRGGGLGGRSPRSRSRGDASPPAAAPRPRGRAPAAPGTAPATSRAGAGCPRS